MPTWNDIKHRKQSGKDQLTCPECSHTRKKKTEKCLSIDYDKGRATCNHCGWGCWREDNTKKENKVEENPVYNVPTFNNKTDLPDGVLNWFLKRGIKQETLLHFKVTHGVEAMPKGGKWSDYNTVQYNYFKDNKLVNTKFKTADKSFKMVTGAEKIPYNLDAIKDSTECLFCEGEEEAMVWWQSGYKYAISVPNGATKGKNNLDYISRYFDSHFANKTKVYIAVDNDEAGQYLRDDLIKFFGKNLCYEILYPSLPFNEGKTTKDANDILLVKGSEFLMELKANAKGFPIEGVFGVEDVEEQMWRQFKGTENYPRGTSTYKPSLDEHWTWRRCDMNVFFGAGNQGKSTFVNELLVHKSMNDGTKWGVFSPEQNPPIDFYNDIIHTYIGKSTDPNFKALQMSEEEYQKGMDFAKKHFVYIYPDGTHDKTTLIDIFKAVIIKNDVDGIVIDPFNQLDRIDREAGLRDDQYISQFGAQFKRFISTHNVYSMIITHGDAKFDVNSNVMLKPNMYRDIEGGKMWSKKADNILFYYRPNFQVNIKDPLCIIGSQKIKKQKLTGIPGEVEYTFDRTLNRYIDRSGIDDFSGKKIPDTNEQVLQLGFPIESWGDATPNFDDEDEAPF